MFKPSNIPLPVLAALGCMAAAGSANAEVLAMTNYESKPPEALAAFKHPVPGETRQEGIAIIDVDPQSPQFGKIVRNIELPPDLVAHHIFYNRDASKAYVTALGKPELRVVDMTDEALPMKVIDVPECEVGENVVFSEDNTKWYLSCMGTHRVVWGDAVSDTKQGSVDLPKPYGHGIAVHDGIDRLLVSNTVRASDLQDAGDSLSVLRASTGEVLGSIKVTEEAGTAPVEVVFVPNSDPPVAYVTNMYGHSLSAVTWNPETESFEAAEIFDFEPVGAAVPLEIYFDDAGETMFVTTAKPGHLHIFDISADVTKPKLKQSIATAEGAHHVGFNKDMTMAWVQNSLLNLPGMSDGSITVVDLTKGEVVASVDTLKNDGFNPNSLVLLPEWNHPAGH